MAAIGTGPSRPLAAQGPRGSSRPARRLVHDTTYLCHRRRAARHYFVGLTESCLRAGSSFRWASPSGVSRRTWNPAAARSRAVADPSDWLVAAQPDDTRTANARSAVMAFI